MARVLLANEEGTNFEKALNLIPHVKRLYDELYDTLWNSDIVEKETKEKIRLYLAGVNGCETCMSMSYVGDEMLNQKVLREKELEEKDRLLFRFIDVYRVRPRELTDADMNQLKKFYSDTQLLELLAVINLFDQFHKMIVSLDLYDFCSSQGK
ncbi:alkylhydroperoxidase family enzyme [Priestia megaterium]|uniref:carboxymuconolactone decarboxylase family protein n=1 Tax=Priestia megaterium TaxID=1404 RepID=UPI000472BA78|nr:hypothetical protein [Priestia megaterium]MED3914934.1 hypothetical protein [Priestia megaterium]PFA97338.1 hypothetical protein CN383_25335 [Priestia megaterium]PFR96938.1 hypothetical protein COK39_06345 [Priestia megaterium]TCN16178.1 AhpD family alkylhydroperoxidase [Bacillus sp. BK006]